jgi:endonuclease/exonuclease/phosphatase family metal-dependent hydrolase
VIFSLATFNVGLLEILGGLYRPVPFVKERLHALPNALRNFGTDVIALQEIYTDVQQSYLASAVRDVYPFYGPSQRQRVFGLENGLMTLSKLPISSALELFRCALPDERVLDNKGMLVSRISTSATTEVLLLNIHTTAGGSVFHPESARTDRVRARQIAQVLDRADREETEERALVIVCGDLNAGPGVSEGNYRQFEERGFVDVHDGLHKYDQEATWDPKNWLNRAGPHHTSPPQRVDHVFVRYRDLKLGRVQPLESRIQSKEEIVTTSDTGKVTLSDHYSVRVVFEINGK